MTRLDHLGITVDEMGRAIEQFDPVLSAMGFIREDAADSSSWYVEGEAEIILYTARERATGPHRHGRVGWQHLAFAVESRAEVDRLHAIALDAGWSTCGTRRSIRASAVSTTPHSSRMTTASGWSSCTNPALREAMSGVGFILRPWKTRHLASPTSSTPG